MTTASGRTFKVFPTFADLTPTLAAVDLISFARGIPAPECLPVEELAECAHAVIERDGRAVLSYGSGSGYAPLRAFSIGDNGPVLTAWSNDRSYERAFRILRLHFRSGPGSAATWTATQPRAPTRSGRRSIARATWR